MSFGFATVVDLLSWAVVVMLAIKVLASIVLLTRKRSTWFDTSSGAWLWWSTKIPPVLAVPCLIAIALIEQDRNMLTLYVGLMLFVLVAVPWKIRSRFYAGRGAASSR